MTTGKPFATKTGQTGEFFVFPDPPKHPEDKMTSFDQLTITGNAHYLAIHLGKPETTLVAGDRYLALAPHPKPGWDQVSRHAGGIQR